MTAPTAIQLTINPVTGTYAALVQKTDIAGNVITSASLSGLSFQSQNAINNGANGRLGFKAQASAGNINALIDNIGIIPEPSTVILGAVGLLGLVVVHQRRRQA